MCHQHVSYPPFKIFCSHRSHAVSRQDDLMIWKFVCPWRSRLNEQNNYYIGTELQRVFGSPQPHMPKMATPINISNAVSVSQDCPQFNAQSKSKPIPKAIDWFNPDPITICRIFLPQIPMQLLFTTTNSILYMQGWVVHIVAKVYKGGCVCHKLWVPPTENFYLILCAYQLALNTKAGKPV